VTENLASPAAPPSGEKPNLKHLAATFFDSARKESKARPLLETYTAADLLKLELSAPRWAVPDIVPEGLTVLAGKPKLGKSWLALNLAMAVAAGDTALDHVEVEGGDVLYVALEDNQRRMKKRISQILSHLGRLDLGRLALTHACPKQDKGGLEEIGAWLADRREARMVIIDTWAKFRPGRKRGADLYSEDYGHAAAVKDLADQAGVPVVVIHHTRKAAADDALDEVSGSAGLTGAADAVLVLRRGRNEQDAKLMITGRDVEEKDLAVRFDRDGGVWEVLGDAREVEANRSRVDVIGVLGKAKQPLTPSKIAKLLDKKPAAIRQALLRMKRDGQVERHDSGGYSLRDRSTAVTL
jgi:hypothetical protein